MVTKHTVKILLEIGQAGYLLSHPRMSQLTTQNNGGVKCNIRVHVAIWEMRLKRYCGGCLLY